MEVLKGKKVYNYLEYGRLYWELLDWTFKKGYDLLGHVQIEE